MYKVVILIVLFTLLPCTFALAKKPAKPAMYTPNETIVDDPPLLWEELNKRYKPRYEFESKEAFAERMKDLPSHEYRFYFHVRPFDIKYNADTKKLYVYLPLSAILGKSTYTYSRSFSDEGSYAAQNAYGAKATISVSRQKDYEINILNQKDIPKLKKYSTIIKDDYKMEPGVEIELDPAEAKLLKESCCGTLACTVATDPKGGGVTYKESYRIDPTIGSPKTTNGEIYGINVILKGVRISGDKGPRVGINYLDQPVPNSLQ